MFRVLLAVLLGVLLLSTSSATASIVIHDGAPGIVAVSSQGSCYMLDSNGHVWMFTDGWLRVPDRDVRVPVENIKFWEVGFLITMDNESWLGEANWGPWPGGGVNIQESTWGQIKARYSENGQKAKEGE